MASALDCIPCVRSARARHLWQCIVHPRPLFIIAALTALFVAVAPPSRAQAPGPAGYRLAAGDKIAITVLGQKDLSGEFTLDAEGSIQLMFVGSVTVKNLMVNEVKNVVTALYADGFLANPQVGVRIVELRPIYVLGAVRKPGSFPFRYGSTIKSALALAGGVGSEDNAARATVADFLGADERLRQLKQTKMELIVRLARLEAQRDGKPDFTVDTSAADPDVGNLDSIIKSEREVLETETGIQKSQVELLLAQKPRLEEEISALRAQLVAEDKQVELAGQQVERYEALAKQGLMRSATESDLKRTRARHESDRWRITADLSHRQVLIGELDVKIFEVQSQFKRQTEVALQDARRSLKQLEISIPLAAEIRASRLLQTGGIVAAEAPYVTRIIRVVDGAASTIEVSDTTILEPGDIVEVKLQRAAVARPRVGSACIAEFGSADCKTQ